MRSLLVQSSFSVWIVHRYDPNSGHAHPRLAKLAGTRPTSGIGSHVRTAESGRIFAALYFASGSIWLGLGPERWDLDSEVCTASHRKVGTHCIFSFSGGATTRSYSYRDPAASLWARLDPTYDAMDRKNDDFLLFACACIDDHTWRASAKQSWNRGLSTG